MPSLLPKNKTIMAPAQVEMDLRYIFESDNHKETIERVKKYLLPIYFKTTGRSFAEISRENVRTEEFFLQMPTREAFASELKLAEAIEMHAAGKVSDIEIKAVLDEFIESHTFVYFQDVNTSGHPDIIRKCKVGDYHTSNWAEYELVYISQGNMFGFTCNQVQAYLLKLFHSDLEFKTVRL